MSISSELPPPGQGALSHSARLKAFIDRQIERAGGRLPFDRYMASALYAPGLGYYTAGATKFGADGDFVTAPEISSLFSRCVARQCVEVLGQLSQPEMLEFGAGSGRMAVDILRELSAMKSLPQRYMIMETSADLRQRQQQRVAAEIPELADRVVWLDQLPETPFEGVVLGNEVLDAMPVSRFAIVGDRVSEVLVERTGDQYRDVIADEARPALEAAVRHVEKTAGRLADGFQSELNLNITPWFAALSSCLSRGVVLLIDYGFSRAEYYLPQRDRGTLMCHYRHRAHTDPYWLPGLQDITAHVDFSSVAEAADANDLDLLGYTTQAFFLLASGLETLVQETDPADVEAYMKTAQSVKTLTLPSEMGERFKCIALGRQFDARLRGFELRDFSDRL